MESAFTCHIAYSTHHQTRLQATSGGIGSTLIAYLFASGRIGTSLTFDFDKETLTYKPRLIYQASDYHEVGSIYHEINLLRFLKENLNKIQGAFACFALPCQIAPIRRLLEKSGTDTYLIQLTCSSQQTPEATRYLLSRLRVAPENVEHIRYRGMGWPGGIHIRKTDGKSVYVGNIGSVWTKIFHSQLFYMPRCFNCPPEFPHTGADIVLADPWQIDNPEKEKAGRTLCVLRNERIHRIWDEMKEQRLIADEPQAINTYNFSQEGPLIRKRNDKRHTTIVTLKKNLILSSPYRRFVLSATWAFDLHCLFIRLLNKILKTVHSKEPL